MEILSLFIDNILSPPILFFALGIFAGLVKSDLIIPDQISKFLSIYLITAIGFKGGVALANTEEISSEMIYTLIAGVIIGFLQPFFGYMMLRLSTKIDSVTAAALAAHYGSISMVTFVTATSFLEAHDIIYAGYIIAVLALMEAPAIFSGLWLAGRNQDNTSKDQSHLLREVFTNGTIMLLLGAFLIGWASGEKGMASMQGFIVDPFKGILALFLLDMGLKVSRQLEHLKEFSVNLVLFGIYMPILGAALGLGVSILVGLDVGTGMLFTTLLASASYIAVSAAMQLTLPEAKEGIYIPMSLAVTFPFNIILGIPAYHALAEMLL